MKEEKVKGKYILFEGLDRTGKTTQISLMKKWLRSQKKKVAVLHTSTLLGKDLGRVKMNGIAKLFAYLAALQEATEKIKSYMEKGYIVLADRHIYSQQVFSVLLSKGTVKAAVIEDINKLFEAYYCLRPDIIFCFLGVPYAEDNFLPVIREELAKRYKTFLDGKAFFIDASSSLSKRAVLEVVKQIYEREANK